MAFDATTIWEVQTGGSDTLSGGGFVPGYTTFPTDLTTDANTGNTSVPVVSSATYNFVAADVGAWVFIKSGTNWIPGWYQIVSVASNKATLNASIGNGVLYNGPTLLNTVVGVATVGTPTAGTWGVDYSQASTRRISYTDMVLTSTTTFTSAANPVGKNLVGNIISVTSGAGFTVQRVAIISTAGTTATADKSMGTNGSTGGNGGLGGAFASPGSARLVKVGGNDVWIKSGTYTLSATANVSGGRVDDNGGAVGNPGRWLGYTTTRGDGAPTKPLLNAGAATIQIFTMTVDYAHVRWLAFGANGFATVEGIRSTSGNNEIRDCDFNTITSYGIRAVGGSGVTVDRCKFTTCTGSGAIIGNINWDILNCFVNGGTLTVGIDPSSSGAGLVRNCVVKGVAGTGFSAGQNGSIFENCVAHGCTLDGFSSGSVACLFRNCIAYGNTDRGFEGSGSNAGTAKLVNCAGGANAANYDVADYPDIYSVEGFITLSADPFTNAAGLDFTLNNTAGGGALLRGTGYPATIPGLIGSNYPNVGAFQHNIAGGASNTGASRARLVNAGAG